MGESGRSNLRWEIEVMSIFLGVNDTIPREIDEIFRFNSLLMTGVFFRSS